MMITLLSSGSRGDTQPYIALGLALKQAGYTVRLAAFENYKGFVEGYGLDYYPIRGDVAAVVASLGAQDAHQADNPMKMLLSFSKLKNYLFDIQKDFYEACNGSDAIVYHPGAAIGYFAAQLLNVPSILATPFPMTPTTAYPSLIFYNGPRLGRHFNRLTHLLFEQILWSTSRASIKQFWKQAFGCIPGSFNSPFGRQTTRRQPTIVSCSNHVFPRPSDWPEHVYNTGYWFVEEEGNWQPPASLFDFLQRGKPPIYVGFGSIGNQAQAAQTTALVVEALRQSGQRGVLATGWNGMVRPDNLPDEIFVLDSAPHTWLFPRMAAVVHHGGAGTTAAGLRAGVPAVIIPHSNDQFAWGRRVVELGVGSRPIPRKQLTAEKLAEAIQEALAPEIRKRAQAVGEKVRAERGSERAAAIIGACLEQPDLA